MIGRSSSLELAVAAQPADRARAVALAEHLDGELLEPVELDAVARCAPRDRARSAAPARTRGRRDAGRNQRARHQALRVRLPFGCRAAAARVARLAHARTAAGTSRERAASSRPSRDDLVLGEDDLRPARARVLRDDVDRGGLELDEVDIRVERAAGRHAARRGLARFRETRTTSASRASARRRAGR